MQEKIHIWLDCDPGLDDTFAIIYAAHHPEINLIGISASPGNTSLANTTQNALNVLYNIGRAEIPVISGSNQLIRGELNLAEHMHGGNGLGGVQLPKSPVQASSENSFEKIYHKICEYPGKIVWANTGSFTNLCILMLSFPKVKDKIQKIVFMGGAIGKGNITPAAEFNIFFDPEAFDQVLKMKGSIAMVMIPLEVTHENLAKQDVFDRLATNQSIPFAKALLNMLTEFKSMYKNAYGFPFPPIHDPCVIHYILHPQEFETKEAIIEVDTLPMSYGRTNCWFSNPRHPSEVIKTGNLVALHLKNQKVVFWEEMFQIFEAIFCQTVQSKII